MSQSGDKSAGGWPQANRPQTYLPSKCCRRQLENVRSAPTNEIIHDVCYKHQFNLLLHGKSWYAFTGCLINRKARNVTRTTPPQPMKIGINLDISEGSFEGHTPTFKDLQAMAQLTEQSGLDSFWLADHLIYRFPGQDELAPWEAFTMLSALAAVTT